MNKERRNRISKVVSSLEELKSTVEALQAEEQDVFDNMPESLQGGDKGSVAEAAADALQSAVDSLEEALSQLGEAMGG